MTSSQTLTFNMLSEAASNRFEIAATMNALLDCEHLDRLESMDFEFAAQGSRYGLGDNTLVDALLRFRTIDGGRQVVAIEAKLADRFSTRKTNAAGGPSYQAVADSGPIWKDLAAAVAGNKTRQLTRCHALAQSVQRHEDSSRQAVLIVLHHPLDISARSCIDEYRKLVRTGVFASQTWDEFVQQAASTRSIALTTASILADRYINLSLSLGLSRGP